MVAFRYKNVCIESYGLHLPDEEITSAEIEDRLSPLYQKLEVPFGTLERVSGIRARRLWGTDVMPSKIATIAAEQALANSGIDRKHIGALFNCSVTRDMFEPATAVLVHRNLGLDSTVMATDITNACIGFSNGLMLLSNLIESGCIKAGLLVSGENPANIVASNFKLVEKQHDTITREDLLKVLPVFTLGSGAVAFVLAHESIATKKHKFLGGAGLSATEHSDLCVGNGDFVCSQEPDEAGPIMHTESGKLIAAAAKLGGKTWKTCSEVLGWDSKDVDHIFCHQVGKQVNDGFYKELGLDYQKEFTIYKNLGNMVSAAMPAALIMGATEKPIKSKDKVVCTAFGSGLNSIFFGIEW